MNNKEYVGRVDYVVDGQYSVRVIYTPKNGVDSGSLVTELSSGIITEAWGDATVSSDNKKVTHNLTNSPESVSANGFSITTASIEESEIVSATFEGSPVEVVFHVSPVAYHGALRLGRKEENENPYMIYNQRDEQVQLSGLSYFWSGFSRTGGDLTDYWQSGVCSKLANELDTPIVRAAISADASDPDGYYNKPDENLEQLALIVEEAKELGQYVIVDFHSHDADVNISDAIEFFTKVSEACSLYQHVIYEIFNEPTENHIWDQVKDYAEQIIPVIRDNASEALIIVGTPTYCQDLGAVIGNEISSSLSKNVMYSLHYYGTCGYDVGGTYLCHDYLRDSLDYWCSKLPIFISEYGHSDPLGGGSGSQDPEINFENNTKWYNLVDSLGLSACHWSICDKDELASMLKRGTSTEVNWNDDDVLTQSGIIIRNRLMERKGYSKPSESVVSIGDSSLNKVAETPELA